VLPERSGGLAEERKVVTVLFCDLVGSTSRADGADPEDVLATLGPYHGRLRDELERYGATVEKFIGDAVMAVFGAPVAHEDDAERAVCAGLRILEAMEELNAEQPGLDLEVRVGIATGEVMVSLAARPEIGQHFVAGDVVNVAARLQHAAPPGAVVVGGLTQRLTRDRVGYEGLSPVAVRGKREPLELWRAVGIRARAGAGIAWPSPTLFVGRQAELVALQSALRRATWEPGVQLVTITGEPGVGKSRLVREFHAWVTEQPDLVGWRQGRCLPYGEGISFWALGEVVKAQAGILESDDEAAAREKLASVIDAIAPVDEDRAWLRSRLGPLVGLTDPSGTGGQPRSQQETFTAWRLFLEAVAHDRPLVVVVEDVHWADPALLEFLEHLVAWSEGAPILVVVTARPEVYERSPAWGGGRRNATTVALGPLTATETGQLLAVLLAEVVLPAEMRTALAERAGGNPLYAEQFARLIVDRGLLAKGGAEPGLVSAEKLPLPDTLAALIAGRLDGLPAGRKALLADAAVLGRVFWSGGVVAVGDRGEADVRLALRDLARAEFVRRVPMSSVAHQEEYSFWHALLRDVAYGSLPRKVRAAKHLAAARWLEKLAGARVADYAELLAYHYQTALECTEDAGDKTRAAELAEPTARYLVIAGDRAFDLAAATAPAHYRRALDLIPAGSPARGAVLVKHGRACWAAGRPDEPERSLREAITEFELHGDTRAIGNAMTDLARSRYASRGAADAIEVLDRAIALLRQGSPGNELADACAYSALIHEVAGRGEEALALADEALDMADPGSEAHAAALRSRGVARCLLGDLGGLEDTREAVRLVKSFGKPILVATYQAEHAEDVWMTEGPRAALPLSQAAVKAAGQNGDRGRAACYRAEGLRFLYDLGDWDELLRESAEIGQVLNDTGHPYWAVMQDSIRALTLAWQGEVEAARAAQNHLLQQARRFNDFQILAPALTAAAVTHLAASHPGQALRLVTELQAAVTDSSSWFWIPYLPDLTRACVAAGKPGTAEILISRASATTTRHRLSLLTAQAMLGEARGAIREAMRMNQEAAAGWSEYGHLFEHGRALAALGRCTLELGDPHAERALTAAAAIFSRLQAKPLLSETQRLLGQANPGPP
jgi:class 3 adenylate cyclase/tetratricopeptide (TPR) repeat protein